jgi:hypothetical protein
MSDARLRELERRWRETADPADERRYLSERVRRGELAGEALELMDPVWSGQVPRERLELLAYAGDPLAVDIRGDEIVELASYLADQAGVDVVLGSEVGFEELEAWSQGLYRWGEEVLVEVLAVFLAARLGPLAAQAPPDPADYDGYEIHDALYDHERLQDALGEAARFVPFLRRLLPGLPEESEAGGYHGPWNDLVHAAEIVNHAGAAVGERRRERLAAFFVVLAEPAPGELLAGLRAHLRATIRA